MHANAKIFALSVVTFLSVLFFTKTYAYEKPLVPSGTIHYEFPIDGKIVIAELAVSKYKYEDSWTVECLSSSVGYADFVKNIFAAFGAIAQNQRECSMITKHNMLQKWDQKTGGVQEITEILTPRYGGKTCTVTTIWPINPQKTDAFGVRTNNLWPPTSNPSDISSSCDQFSDEEKDEMENAVGSFKPKVIASGKATVVKKLSTGLTKTTKQYSVNTNISLNITGAKDKILIVTLHALAYEIYNYSSYGAKYRILSPRNFIVAGKKPDSDNIVTVSVSGDSSIDVTPIANVPFYTFGLSIQKVEEK